MRHLWQTQFLGDTLEPAHTYFLIARFWWVLSSSLVFEERQKHWALPLPYHASSHGNVPRERPTGTSHGNFPRDLPKGSSHGKFPWEVPTVDILYVFETRREMAVLCSRY